MAWIMWLWSSYKSPNHFLLNSKFQVAKVIKEALEVHFPESEKVRIIAEPGRYFVASAFTLAVNVTAVRVVARDCQTFKVPQSEGKRCYSIPLFSGRRNCL